MTDEEIIADNISDSGSDKLAVLISRYSDRIFMLANKYSSSADMQELVSEGFDALVRAVYGFDSSKGTFSAFVSRCIDNSMKNVVARYKNVRCRPVSDEELALFADPKPTMEELILLRETTDAVGYHIEHSLTELERYCINGVILGLSYEEIASQLSVDKKSVDNAVSRARAKLRKLCPDACGGIN